MKVLIDIPEEEYLMIKTKIITGDDGYLDRAVADGIQIPDNATNGDVVTALFPTADISLNDSCFEGVVNKYGFDMKWWNSPYQKGGKDEQGE